MNQFNRFAKGMVWSSMERLSVQAIQFGVGIVLARLLSPTEYGTVGILLVITSFLQVFIDSGFSKALIQKQNRTQTDISTVFLFNIGVSIFCYLLLWCSSSFIAQFYNDPQLVNYILAIGITLFFNALITIPLTLLTIDLNFKAIAKVNLIATVISGIIAIFMAYTGYGIWALVFQTINRVVISSLLIWFFVKWRPNCTFSRTSFKSLFPFGSKVLYASLLNMVATNITSIFIAKLTSLKDLGFYTRGAQFADVIYGTLTSVLNSVLLPTLATMQDERERFVRVTRSIFKSTALIIMPLILLLVVIAEPLIRILLTDKWMMAVPIMQIMCLARLISIVSGINGNVLNAIGRSDLALKLQYFKLFVRILFLGIALKYGIIFIALAELLSTIVHFYINAYYSGKILNYGCFKQLKDILPMIISSLIMLIGAYLSIYLIKADYLKVLIAPFIGMLIYLCVISRFKVPELILLSSKFKHFLFSKNIKISK